MPADEGDLPTRVRGLEHRVAALENRAAGRPATDEEARAGFPDGPDAERFWALDGLKSRVARSGAVLFTGAVTLPTDEHVEWQYGVPTDELVGADWSAASDVLGALAHPVRLTVLGAVLEGVRTVADLGELEASGPAASSTTTCASSCPPDGSGPPAEAGTRCPWSGSCRCW